MGRVRYPYEGVELGTSARTLAAVICISVTALLSSSCASGNDAKKGPAVLSSTTSTTPDGNVISDQMIGSSHGTMLLAAAADDPNYAYTQGAPVQIGGGFGAGSDRTYKYLNSLRGPKGEAIKYDRVGTCCPFKSPNSPFDGEALLEVYQVTLPNGDARRVYFDWYTEGRPLVPVGLTSAH